MLDSEDIYKRFSAATSLIDARDPAAMEGLRAALAPGKRDDIRISVIKAFEVRGNDEAIPEIITALGAKNETVRQAAAEALASITTPRAVTRLVAAAGNAKASPRVRAQVIMILGEMRKLDAVPTLIVLLSDQEEGVRKAANAALESITRRSFETGREWLQWWERTRKLDRTRLLEDIIAIQNGEIRRQKLQLERVWLRLLQERQEKGDPALLMEALSEGRSEKVELYAIRQLTQVKTGDKKTQKAVINALTDALKNENMSVRAKAAEALGQRDDPVAVAGLIRALDDPAPPVKQAAAASLGALRATIAVGPLGKTITSPNPAVAAAAATALGQIGHAAGVRALVRALTGRGAPPDPSVYEAAAKALASIKDAQVLPILTDKLLQSTNVNVRYAAVRALGGHDPKKAIPPLSRVAQGDANPQIRSAAVTALAETRDAGAVQAVVRALSDKEKTVADHAFRSLMLLGDGKTDRFAAAIDQLVSEKRFGLAENVLAGAVEQLKVRPNHAKGTVELRNRLAMALAAAQAWQKAKPLLEDLVSADPENPEYLKALIACRKALKEYDALIPLLKQARRTVPSEGTTWWAETVTLVQTLYDGGSYKLVIALVAALEEEDTTLGGKAAAKVLRELRDRANEKVTPPPPVKPPADAPEGPKPAAKPGP